MKYRGKGKPEGAKFFQCWINPYFFIPAKIKAKKVIVAIANVTFTLAVTVCPPLDNKYKTLSLLKNSALAPSFPIRPVKSKIGIKPNMLPNNTKKKIV